MTVSRTGRLAKAALFPVALALPAALPVRAASAAQGRKLPVDFRCSGTGADPGERADFTTVQNVRWRP